MLLLACTGEEDQPPIRTNNAPVVASVLLEPDPAHAGDSIRAVALVSDLDGDEVTASFQWEVDGLALAVEGDTLPPLSAIREQTVRVEVGASDGFAFATPLTAEITLVNSPPVVDELVIDPATPGIGDPLKCVPTSRDDDGDELSTDTRWYVEGQLHQQQSPTLVAQLARNTEVWCTVQLHDQESSSAVVESPHVFIGNSPPTAPGIALIPDPPTACATGRVEVVQQSVDPDGDPLSYLTTWLDEGGGTVWSDAEYPSETFETQKQYSVRVVADDGFFQSDPAVLEFQAVAGGETIGNGIDDDCDGEIDEWIDYAFQAQQLWFDDTPSAGAGFTLGAGDVDGDGRDDVAVGRSGPDDVLIFLGSDMDPTHPLLDGPAYTIEGASRNNALALGEVDGDGLADLLIPAPGADPGGVENAGAVYLVLGADVGDGDLEDLAVWALPGQQAGDLLGDAVALGDLDGDGLDERVVGNPNADAPGFEAGVVYIFSDNASTLDDADIVLEGGVRRGRLGTSVAVIPDVDGDGLAELAAGAPDRDDKATDSGTVVIWLNPTDGYASEAAIRIHGSVQLAHVGREQATSGDIDGDGLADVAIGSEENVGNTHMPGTISLFAGSDLAGGGDFEVDDAWLQVQGVEKDAWLGLYGAGPLLGDTDGNGTADLVAGVPGEGRIVLWRGAEQLAGSSGVLTTDDALISIGQGEEGDDFGRWALLADTDGDGIQDMVGAAFGADTLAADGGGMYVFRPPFGEEARSWEPECEKVGDAVFCRTPMSWEEARNHCDVLALDLVKVADSSDNADLATVAATRYPAGVDRGNWWLGLRDEDTEGTWVWLDESTETSYSAFGAGQNSANRNCAVLNEPSQGSWAPADCSVERFFICR